MTTQPQVPEITADELRRALEAGEALTVLDVRRAASWSEWSVPGSVNTGGIAGVASYQPARGERVVTVCGHGNSSRRAAHELIARGVNAVSLQGGMSAWSLAWNVADVRLPAGAGVDVVQVRRTGKGCLSYVIIARDAAAVIDPSVDPGVYAAIAAQRGARIVAILETHIHADHLSRAHALVQATGATLYLPEQRRATFRASLLADGATVPLGDAAITVLRTPGHTFESSCYAVGGALFTGDTLFLDSVGRPDLKAGTGDETRERARLLHASLARLRRLDAQTLVLPGHTSRPVPFDGAALTATIGEVGLRAGALLALDEAAFVTEIVSRIPEPPENHLEIVRLNETGEWPVDPSELEAGANRCAVG